MKKNLLVLLSLLVIASVMLAACATEAPAEPEPMLVRGAEIIEKLTPREGYNAVVALGITYSENADVAETWIKSYWKMVESPNKVLTAPSEVVAKMKLRDTIDVTAKFAPGAQASVSNGKPEEYQFLSVSVSGGWTCDRRLGEDIWDCKAP
jgi:hypothetical protein